MRPERATARRLYYTSDDLRKVDRASNNVVPSLPAGDAGRSQREGIRCIGNYLWGLTSMTSYLQFVLGATLPFTAKIRGRQGSTPVHDKLHFKLKKTSRINCGPQNSTKLAHSSPSSLHAPEPRARGLSPDGG